MKWLLLVGLCIISYYNALCQNTNALDHKIRTTTQQLTPPEIEKSSSFQLKSAILNAISTYHNNFEHQSLEIHFDSFNISPNIPGFEGGVLHTPNPYPASLHEDSVCQMSAVILHPIILRENSTLSFDEVVLVEPSEISLQGEIKKTSDCVMIQASKNNGESWIQLSDDYDSGIEPIWENLFSGSIYNAHSYALASQNILKHKSIKLTEHPEISRGDTILLRFVLISDHSITGWGWAIDNLEITHEESEPETDFLDNFKIFPNPCRDYLTLECVNHSGPDVVDINIVNQTGSLMYSNKKVDSNMLNRMQIDISSYKSGIYYLFISNGAYYKKSQKIVKL